jgi:DNA end-binding protein Ku
MVRTVLALHTLYFADEVRDPGELDHVPGRRRASGADKELDMATGLIESMSAPWRPERYRDSYRDRVRKLIEDKRSGREVVTESEAPEPTDMSDLLEACSAASRPPEAVLVSSRGPPGSHGAGSRGAGRQGAGRRPTSTRRPSSSCWRWPASGTCPAAPR